MARKLTSGKSKLSSAKKPNSPKRAVEGGKLNIVPKKKKTPIARSFRFHDIDVSRLKEIAREMTEINETGRVISETAVLKGLILLGAKTKPERLLKAIKEAS